MLSLVRAYSWPMRRPVIKDPLSGKTIVKAGELIDEVLAEKVETAGVNEVIVRSVLTCEGESNGICANLLRT